MRYSMADTIDGTAEVQCRSVETAVIQGTIEGLRAQLEAARHAHVRSTADEACGGVSFGCSAHRGAAQGAARAADELAEALPGLHDALREVRHDEGAQRVGDGRGGDSCGSPVEPDCRMGEVGSAAPGSGSHQPSAAGVMRCADALRQVKQLMTRSCMFYEVRPPCQAVSV